jgi:hypothetical protein
MIAWGTKIVLAGIELWINKKRRLSSAPTAKA